MRRRPPPRRSRPEPAARTKVPKFISTCQCLDVSGARVGQDRIVAGYDGEVGFARRRDDDPVRRIVRWHPGRAQESASISTVKCGTRASILPTACRNQSATGKATTMRFLRARLAISQADIGDTCRFRSTIAARASASTRRLSSATASRRCRAGGHSFSSNPFSAVHSSPEGAVRSVPGMMVIVSAMQPHGSPLRGACGARPSSRHALEGDLSPDQIHAFGAPAGVEPGASMGMADALLLHQAS